MKAFELAMSVAVLAGAATFAQAAPIAATASGNGSFVGSAGVLVDGVVPAQGTPYNDGSLVTWSSLATVFELDFGSVQTVGSLLLSADNNDTYQVSSSTDGVAFLPLFTVLASDGTVTPAAGGTDDFSTDPASAFYVGRGFAPVSARYLELQASSGDSIYTAGELDAFAPAAASAVPEPASVGLVMAGLVGVVAFGRKRAR